LSINPKDTKWKVKFYAGNASTHYFPSDIRMKTSRYDVTIKDYEWSERSSKEFFNPKTLFSKGHNPAQILDEPTNFYTLAFEKKADIFFVSVFHPKFFEKPDQVKLIQGTVDGVEVYHRAPVNTPFHGYNQWPGEMKLVRNENTYRQMEYEVGYAHKFQLCRKYKFLPWLENLKAGNFGRLYYIFGASAGVQIGTTYSSAVQKDRYWDFDGYTEKTRVQGFGGSLRNKIEWLSPNGRFGVFVEIKISLYHRKHDLLDGTQVYNLRYTANNLGLTFMLHNPNKKLKSAPAL
jgi:hypothetical protein